VKRKVKGLEMAERKCGNCRFFVPLSENEGPRPRREAGLGECHKKSPHPASFNPYKKLLKDEAQTAYWAKVPADTFCGDFEEK
jgi:hypothetical protein